MSLCCCWKENGSPVEHTSNITHLKKADAASIYSALIECLKQKQLEVSRIVGMGLDGASTFSGGKSGVQYELRRLLHMVFLCTGTATCCSWHVFKLPIQFLDLTMCMTLKLLWKLFQYHQKRTESLKEIQCILDMLELKVIKPSGTCW